MHRLTPEYEPSKIKAFRTFHFHLLIISLNSFMGWVLGIKVPGLQELNSLGKRSSTREVANTVCYNRNGQKSSLKILIEANHRSRCKRQAFKKVMAFQVEEIV